VTSSAVPIKNSCIPRRPIASAMRSLSFALSSAEVEDTLIPIETTLLTFASLTLYGRDSSVIPATLFHIMPRGSSPGWYSSTPNSS